MKKQILSILCAVGLLAGVAPPSVVLAQSGSSTSVTIAQLAGTWVEPETNSYEDGLKIVGTENIVVIQPDGRFNDSLKLTFTFDGVPEYNGTYALKTSGRVSISGDNITWSTDTAEVVPVYPSNATSAQRDEMQVFASLLRDGMISAETYPIISYDGQEMVMNAGSDSLYEEYVMTRR